MDFFVRKFSKIDIICFLVSIFCFIITLFITKPYESSFSLEQKIIYYSVKVLSFISILLFWKFVSFCCSAYVVQNKKGIFFGKCFLAYFILNIIILALTSPVVLYEQSVLSAFDALNNYFVSSHPNWLQGLNISVAYNILPFSLGPSIYNIFLYSLVFAYCISCGKEKFQNKAYFLIIAFCCPFVLVLNQLPTRMIFTSYLFIFVFSFIYFNIDKKINLKSELFLFSLFAGILASIRSEYFLLLFFIPVIVYYNKIFQKKSFIVFLFIFYFLFCGTTFVQKKMENFMYELHNLSYVYDEYFLNNMYDLEIEQNSSILKKVYAPSFEKANLPSSTATFDLSDNKNVVTSINILVKFALKNSIHFLKRNISSFLTQENDIFLIELHEQNARLENKDNLFPYLKKENLFQHKITSYLLYFNADYNANNISKILYSPLIAFIAIFITFLVGLFRKDNFFIFNFIIWVCILFLTLVFIFWNIQLYFFVFIQNAYYIFVLSILSIFKKGT